MRVTSRVSMGGTNRRVRKRLQLHRRNDTASSPGDHTKMTLLSPSIGLGTTGMTRPVIFFSLLFLISALLVFLYIFGFFHFFLAILTATTLLIVYLLFHPRN